MDKNYDVNLLKNKKKKFFFFKKKKKKKKKKIVTSKTLSNVLLIAKTYR